MRARCKGVRNFVNCRNAVDKQNVRNGALFKRSIISRDVLQVPTSENLGDVSNMRSELHNS